MGSLDSTDIYPYLIQTDPSLTDTIFAVLQNFNIVKVTIQPSPGALVNAGTLTGHTVKILGLSLNPTWNHLVSFDKSGKFSLI